MTILSLDNTKITSLSAMSNVHHCFYGYIIKPCTKTAWLIVIYAMYIFIIYISDLSTGNTCHYTTVWEK